VVLCSVVSRVVVVVFQVIEFDGHKESNADAAAAADDDSEEARARRAAKEAAWAALAQQIDLDPSDASFYSKCVRPVPVAPARVPVKSVCAACRRSKNEARFADGASLVYSACCLHACVHQRHTRRYLQQVKGGVAALKRILEALEAREHERVWAKNQTVGELDDGKLIHGLTGERAIYRRRAPLDGELNLEFSAPKRLHLLFDLSMSMSRFWADGRLQRSLETAVMVMEAFDGFERKIK
jgi:hypothetical protein